MAFRKIHRKAVEIDTKEPKQEFTLLQHNGWVRISRYLDYGCGKSY